MKEPEDRKNPELTIDAITGAPRSPFDKQQKNTDLIAGNYLILERIGEGGMSVVYRARHQHLGREVAVKLLHPHLITNKTSIERFKQEAKAVSQLHHKGVVAIHDFGLTEDNRPYLVMDLLVGKSLSDLIKDHNHLDQSVALPIFIQIAEALAYTHDVGIIHRDLKPSNIIILAQDQVRIVDFGIAKLQLSEGSDGAALTQTGEVFGSPLYMSPEQCKGEKLDNRSDIYSMGCLMYEVLTGKPPVNGTNMLEILYRHMNEVPKPMQIDGKDLPVKLQSIVFKAMAKDPRDRYQSMTALAQALELYLRQKESLFDRLKSSLSFYRTKRKRLQTQEKLALLLSSAAVLSLLVTAALAGALYLTGAGNLTLDTVPDWQRTSDQKSSMTGSDYYVMQLSKSKTLEQLKFHYQQLLKKQEQKSESDIFTDQNELVQTSINSAKRLLRDRHPLDAAELAELAQKISLIENGPKSMLTLEAMILTAQSYYAGGEYEKAIAAFQDLFLKFGASPEGIRQFPVGVLCTLAGDCYYHMHQYSRAKQALGDARFYFSGPGKNLQSIEAWQQENAAFCLSRCGDVEFDLKNYKEASKYYQQAEASWSAIHDPLLDYNRGLALYKMAISEALAQDFKTAESTFEQLSRFIKTHRQNQLLVETQNSFTAHYIDTLKNRGDWLDSVKRVMQSGFVRWTGQ